MLRLLTSMVLHVSGDQLSSLLRMELTYCGNINYQAGLGKIYVYLAMMA